MTLARKSIVRALSLALLVSVVPVSLRSGDPPATSGGAGKGAAGEASPGRELSAEAKERLKERDRHAAEVLRLGQEGRLVEAIVEVKKKLAIEREVLGEVHEDVAGSLQWLAVMEEAQGDFKAAEKHLDKVLSIREKLHGRQDWRVTDARLDLEDLRRRNDLGPEERSKLKEADKLNQQVSELCVMGRSREALPLAKREAEIRGDLQGEESWKYARSLSKLGMIYHQMGEDARAETLLRQALEIWKKACGEEHPNYATNLNDLGVVYHSMRDYARAEPLYLQALEITKKVLGEEHNEYAASLDNLGMLYLAMGDYGRAEPFIRKALEFTKEAIGEEHPDYATGLNVLAVLYGKMGDYARAEPLIREALEIIKEALGEERTEYATSLNNLGALYMAMKDYARAESLFHQASEILKKALGEEHPDYARSLNNLGTLYLATGDYDRAEALFRQAFEIIKNARREDHPIYDTILNNLAELYRAVGDYVQAKPLYQQACESTKKTLGEEHPNYATILNNLGLLCCDMGDFAQAQSLYTLSIEIQKRILGEEHPNYATSLKNLGGFYHTMGDYARAEPLLKDSLGISRRNLELASGVQSERQQLAMARALRGTLDDYLSLAPRAEIPAAKLYEEVLVWKGAVSARQRRQRLERGRPELRSLFADLASTASRLATLAFSVPDPKNRPAWKRQIEELTERKEGLERELSRQSAEFRREKALQRRSPAELQGLLPPEAALIDFLEYTRWSRREAKDGPEGSGSGSTPKGGPRSPLERERHLAAFVVRRDGPIVELDLGPLEPIAEAIDAWRRAIGTAREDPSLELRRRLWEPLEKHLGGARLLLVSPDGALGRFPLGGLPGKEPGRYLLEEFSVALLPVPQMLPELLSEERSPPRGGGQRGDSTAPKPSLLLLGDVNYEAGDGEASRAPLATGGGDGATKRSAPRGGARRSWRRLDATGGEIAMVRGNFERAHRGAPVLELRGGGATEAALRAAAPGCRFLHLATHGFFAPEELRSALAPSGEAGEGLRLGAGDHVRGWHPDLLSGLVLAGANLEPDPARDDGILTALELGQLDLSEADLLVFSACETGLGETAGGEGLLGLQRAAQVAGARTVVATLWGVDDRDAQELMAIFYENLWSKGMPKLQALREAQIRMLGGGRLGDGVPRGPGKGVPSRKESRPLRTPPRAWAAWVLSGDWR